MAIIGNKYFKKDYNPERIVTLAIYHDATEVITGDLPTPVKYFNADIKQAYKDIENTAVERLLSFLPQDLQGDYEDLFKKKESDEESWKVVKAADSMSAYIKCLEESAIGNKEFNRAKIEIEQALVSMNMEEVNYFRRHFLHSFSLSLDEMSI